MKLSLVKNNWAFFQLVIGLILIPLSISDYNRGDYFGACFGFFACGVSLASALFISIVSQSRKMFEIHNKSDRRHIQYLEQMIETMFDGEKEKMKQLSEDYLAELEDRKKGAKK